MSKRPAFQFYPSDWRNDAGLRLCSIGARGLWIEMMCLMHDATPYGHLTVMGRAIAPDALARLAGGSVAAVKRWLVELEQTDVFSRTDDGVIFSRRMVRDEDIREARAAGGSAGASHGHKGALHGSKGGRPRKDKPPLDDDQRGVILPPPSSSSPSPSPDSSEANASGAEAPLDADLIDPEKLVFDQGIRLLAAAGVPEAKARRVLGKWKRDHGPPDVIAALGSAQRAGAIDPISFIEGIFNHGQRPVRQQDRPSGAIESRRQFREQHDVDDRPGDALG